MCGRMLILTYDEVLDVLQAVQAGPDNPYPDWPARAPINAVPQDAVPVISGVGPGASSNALSARVLNWGYPVHWQQYPVYNTRIESLAEGRTMWRDSFDRGRCLVPTRGFFERHATEKTRSGRTGRLVKRQYEFTLVEEPLTWLAGISEGDHFSVVTTVPNRYVAPVHDRMPLVLRREELPVWMAGDYERLVDRSDVGLTVRPEGECASDDSSEQLSLF